MKKIKCGVDDKTIQILPDTEKETCWKLYTDEETVTEEGIPPYSRTVYSLYLYGEIIEPMEYSEIFHIMRNTTEYDTWRIHIDSPGGDMYTLYAFESAITACKSDIEMYVDGEASSAAFCLAFMGDDLILSEYGQMMCHNVHMYSKSLNEMASTKKHVERTLDTYKKLLSNYCYMVLTEDEINSVVNDGAELYFTAEDIRDRINDYMENHKEEVGIEPECECEACKHEKEANE